MSTDAASLRAGRFSEIGRIIQSDAGVLIERWSRRAMEEQSHARRVHHLVLQDHLSGLLSALAQGLIESGDPDQTPHLHPARQHGEQRWETGWSLSEVVRDYEILRLVVLEYLDEALNRSLMLREVLAVGLALDEAIETSVARYTEFRDAEVRQQNEALREADRHKNEFLAILAHEMRNPLAPLRNALDVARLNQAVPEELRGIMDRQVQQLSRLVDDLLDISSIALGRLELRSEQLDLLCILRDAVQMNAPLAKARGHEVVTDLPQGECWVTGDRGRLIQIFVNLLNNAVKYTPDQGRVVLEASRADGQICIRVRDSGMGIPGEMINRIFDLFTQLSRGSESVSEGLGIGLALVRKLVELHGGTIRAQSAGIDQGSEFIVDLPIASGERAAPSSPVTETRQSIGQRILLIEDNPDGRRSLAMLLKLMGHSVSDFADGRSGIEAAASDQPDVALIDIGLPDTNGYEVAKQLRTLLGQQTLLVALTGYSQPEDRRRAIEAGFNAHLTKPVDLATLQSLMAAPRRPAEVTDCNPGNA